MRKTINKRVIKVIKKVLLIENKYLTLNGTLPR
jgi:hypothetical protein